MKFSASALSAKMDNKTSTKEAVVMQSSIFTQDQINEGSTHAQTIEVAPDLNLDSDKGASGVIDVSKPVKTAVGNVTDQQEEISETVVSNEQAATVVEEQAATVAEEQVVERTVVEKSEPVESSGHEKPEHGFEEVEESETVLVGEQSIGDSNVFKQLTQTSEQTGLNSNSSYAELVENMVSQQCQLSGVKNLDLTTFGLRAQVLSFPNLSVLNYGNHKFLGAPFTEEEENLIVHRLALHVAQSSKKRIVVRAVQEVKDERGMSFFSLLFSDTIAQKFADMFNYVVHANLNEADVSKLVLVIQK